MAWISENSITIKLQTLSFKENGCGVVDVEITPDEAKDLMKLLNKRYGGENVALTYPPNVRNTEGCLDKNWLKERYSGDNWEDVMEKTTGIVEDKNRSTS